MKITLHVLAHDIRNLPDGSIKEQIMYQVGKAILKEDARIIREAHILQQHALRLQDDRADLAQITSLLRSESPEYLPNGVDGVASLACLNEEVVR